MMRHFLIVSLLASVAVANTPLTLNPDVVDAAKRAVFNGEPMVIPGVKVLPDVEQGDVALWQQAMDAAGTELMPVHLLALLQRLNPDKPMEQNAALYAEALRLHVLAAAGNKAAKVELASALRIGVLPNGMRLICDAAVAAAMQP